MYDLNWIRLMLVGLFVFKNVAPLPQKLSRIRRYFCNSKLHRCRASNSCLEWLMCIRSFCCNSQKMMMVYNLNLLHYFYNKIVRLLVVVMMCDYLQRLECCCFFHLWGLSASVVGCDRIVVEGVAHYMAVWNLTIN